MEKLIISAFPDPNVRKDANNPLSSVTFPSVKRQSAQYDIGTSISWAHIVKDVMEYNELKNMKKLYARLLLRKKNDD